MSRPASNSFIQGLAGKSRSNELKIANHFTSIGYVFEYLNVRAPGVEESHDAPSTVQTSYLREYNIQLSRSRKCDRSPQLSSKFFRPRIGAGGARRACGSEGRAGAPFLRLRRAKVALWKIRRRSPP